MTSNTKLVLALIALLGGSPLASAATPPAAAKEAKPAESNARPISYEELEQQVGAEIAVETTLNTVRRGVLVKYTNPVLTLKLGEQAGSIDLSVPRETIRGITLIAPAQPAAEQGSGSAKKN